MKNPEFIACIVIRCTYNTNLVMIRPTGSDRNSVAEVVECWAEKPNGMFESDPGYDFTFSLHRATPLPLGPRAGWFGNQP